MTDTQHHLVFRIQNLLRIAKENPSFPNAWYERCRDQLAFNFLVNAYHLDDPHHGSHEERAAGIAALRRKIARPGQAVATASRALSKAYATRLVSLERVAESGKRVLAGVWEDARFDDGRTVGQLVYARVSTDAALFTLLPVSDVAPIEDLLQAENERVSRDWGVRVKVYDGDKYAL